MDDLTAFLGERYDEAEALAKAAVHSPELPDMLRWEAAAYAHTGVWRIADRCGDLVTEVRAETADDGEVARFIAACDPAHRLADIALKRAILAGHRSTVTRREQYAFDPSTGEPVPDEYDGDCEICGWFGPEHGGCATVRQLGTEFAGHPQYRQEWKPVTPAP